MSGIDVQTHTHRYRCIKIAVTYLGIHRRHSWHYRDVVLCWSCCCWSCGFRMLDCRHCSHGSLVDRLCFARLQTLFKMFGFFGVFFCNVCCCVCVYLLWVAFRECVVLNWLGFPYRRNKKGKKLFVCFGCISVLNDFFLVIDFSFLIIFFWS